jgi:bacterioferritin
MKGNARIIEILNEALVEELTAINQYMVHSEMCDDWGYTQLHEKTEKRAIDEMKHAEAIIARIIFLEGTPTVSKLSQIRIGKTVQEMFKNDVQAEYDAVKMYQNYVKECIEIGDAGTREILEDFIEEEEEHTDWLESQLDQIDQMGIENYLAIKTKED